MNRKQRRAAMKGNVSPSVGEAEALNKQGLARIGQSVAEAADFFRRACALQPNHAEAHNNLGAALHSLGRHEEAAEACRQALALRPDYASAHYNRALALEALGRLEEAVASYRAALAIRPQDPETLNNLGVALDNLGQSEAAAGVFRAVLLITPGNAEALNNLGVILATLGKYEQGIIACHRAILLTPDYVEAYGNLGGALFEQGRFDDAAVMARAALRLQPDFADGHTNLGTALQSSGHLPEAIAAYRRAIRIAPDAPDAHYNLAIALLLRGDYADGWREYEWRWRGGIAKLKPRDCPEPRWAGEDLAGRTLLLHGEQGLGDVLHFARYASLAAARGARVILEVYPPLKRLLSSVPGVAQVIATTDPKPPFDYHLSLLSAPLLLGTRLDSIPASIPYVTPDDTAVATWKDRLDGLTGLKIGLVWSGNPRPHDPRANAVDRRRSMSLLQLKPLLTLPGLNVVSLQKGGPAKQIDALPEDLKPLDLMNMVGDFADTAALVANLDLVVTVDTSVAHLAGAMGKPVWILSRFDGCWRWLQDRDDSPWYPTAKIYRQETPGDWGAVVARIAADLNRMAARTTLPNAKAAEAAFHAGLAAHTAGNLDAAEAAYRRALSRNPDYPEAQSNLGCLLRTQGHLEEALTLHRAAERQRPRSSSVQNNLGIVLKDLLRPDEAIAAFRAAIALRPDHARAHTNLAHALLLRGQYAEGWREYAWRWKGGGDYLSPRTFPQPQWAGEDLTGQTLLLHAEQGLGDVLQFVRYATPIAARGARVILEVQPSLKRLLASVPGVSQVVAGDGVPLPAFDKHLPLLSAPEVLGTTLETIPATIPYLTPQPAPTAAWGARLAGLIGLKVGLVWAGEPWPDNPEAHAIDQRRSIPLTRLSPLLTIPGVRFVSLQKGAAAAQLQEIAEDLRPLDLMAEVEDFADTAALVAHLDLIITVDTAVAHLAGAMGKPVWIASRLDGCWRWLMDRDDSPWYPTARLFRQSTPGDWDEVVSRIATELGRLLQSDGVRTTGGEDPTGRLFAQAIAHHQAGRLDEAEALYRDMLSRESDASGHAEAHSNLGVLFRQRGDMPAAIAHFRCAIALKPDYAEAHNNLGLALNDLGDARSAVACYDHALAVQPDNPRLRSNLGVALQTLGRTAEAVTAYRRAIALQPDQAGTHYNLAQALLLLGAYEEGWREHEWLWRGGVETLSPRNFPQPRWNGGALDGKTILLYAEQGLGDALQFARFATAIAAKGAHVLLEVHPPLKRLLASVPGVSEVVAIGEALPAFDCHLPLMGAPHRLGTRLETIPAAVPYVAPETADAARWEKRLQKLPGLKVGLVWAGDPRPGDLRAHVVDRRRSLSLRQMAPLLDIPNLSFVSLQKGGPAAQVADIAPELQPLDVMDEIGDFADTAALVANLDLVITVDTSVAHLAGAMGKPVWILSRFDGCWRWLADREDSPWYPTARLFRQTTPGDWETVVARVAANLRKLAAGDRQFPPSPPVMAGLAPAIHAVPEEQASDTTLLFAQALEHHKAGRLGEAESLYRRILNADPAHFDSLHHLGLIALWSGDYGKAAALIGQAIVQNRRHAGAHVNLGIALMKGGRAADAAIALRMAGEIDPADATLCYQLAVAWHDLGQADEAAAAYRAALALRADFPAALINLAGLHGEKEDFASAIALSHRAIVLDPTQARAYSNLGSALHEAGFIDSAVRAYHQAITLAPDMPEPHHNLATALLLQGDYADGWREYEWRWQGGIPDLPPRAFSQPEWQGEDLAGRTILAHGEQGLGDVLQFVRYVPLLAAAGARVVLEVYPPLARLAASVPGVSQVVARGEPLPDFDCHVPLMGLPLRLNTTLSSIPSQVPYVAPGAAQAAAWGERLAALPGLKVGLVWAGDPRTHNPRNNTIDRRRSITLPQLSPLLAVPGVSFVSLQKGTAAAQIRDLPPERRPRDWMDEIGDFADTAAMIAHLDLVIAVDTSVAHLAGAMGKPVWILTRFNGCWRWLAEGDTSPWYPTARLFRQATSGDWTGPIAQAATALAALASADDDTLFAQALDRHQNDRLHEAEALYRRILQHQPQQPVVLHHLGVIAQQNEKPANAVAWIRQALCVKPDYGDALCNLAIALRDQGLYAQALVSVLRAVRMQPDLAEPRNNLGGLYRDLGRLDDSIAAFRTALAILPDHPEIHCNLAAALLQRGDYAEGWREHEWRLNSDASWVAPRTFAHPRWTGEDLRGRTLLLHTEQGLGDDLQFCRYAGLLADRGATVILEVPSSLTRLLVSVPGVTQVVAKGEALPPFDYHLSLMSAPHLLGTTLETIPTAVPYVTPDADLVAVWKQRLAHLPGLKVGLVWAGDPRPYDRRAHAIDRRRSIALSRLAALLSTPGASVVSLQKGPARRQGNDLPSALRPLDLMDEVADFADTAALVANLDLVITVDTSVVHLAGAMGKPVWILSRFDGCWRWLADREDSPWYPTARLFRQTTPGDWDEVITRVAIALAERAGRSFRSPVDPTATRLLAIEHLKAGCFVEAEALYRQILVDLPDYAEAHNNFGVAHNDQGHIETALDCYRRALAVKPDYAMALNNLGKSLKDLGRVEEAIVFYRRALQIDPRFAIALTNLGAALQDLGRLAEAVRCYRHILALHPDHPVAHNNLGVTLLEQGHPDVAAIHGRRATDIAPGYAEAHTNLAMSLLAQGQFESGWREYEWRWRGGIACLTPRNFHQPRWAGEEIKGRTILLYGEQGLGDMLQFARYADVIATRGARVILEVHPVLKRLATTIPGVAQVIATGETPPAFDCHLPLLSAPFVMGTTLETIPAPGSYVHPDPEQAALWAKRLSGRTGLKVGLVWAGEPRSHDPGANLVDRRRSIPLAGLTPVLSVPGVSFVSLQKGAAATQIQTIAPDLRPLDVMDEIGDFADTAALVANLDLIITVDTSVAHLAGTMGKPVWILSRFDGCWRWLTDREDSPWYPTARLFRQETAGDWNAVVARVADELRNMVTGDRQLPPSLLVMAGLDPAIHAVPEAQASGGGKTVDARIKSGHDARKSAIASVAMTKKSDPPAADLFAEAVDHHRAGRLGEAARLYERILAIEPDNVGCLFHLGLIAQQQGRHDDAVAYLNRALARNTGHPGIHDTLGTSLLALGRLAEAVASHQRALALKPDFFEACYNLGNAYQMQGDVRRATACFRQTLIQRPDVAEPYNNLGNLLASEKNFDEAAIVFRRAIAIRPEDAAAHNNLGNVFKERYLYGDAALCFEQALHLQPDYVEAHYNLGNTLLEAAMLDKAIVAFRRAVAMQPNLTEAYNNLGSALYMQENVEEAITCYDRALLLNPRFPEAHSNMGTVYREQGDLDRAETAYRHALVLDPGYVLAHCNLAVTRLLRGDYAEGLREFEWRRQGERTLLKPRADLPPRWTGENPAGRTILLQAEQGLGDVLQFCRYAGVIAAKGGRVILDVYPPLKRLLTSVPGVAEVIATDDALPPGIDWHLPMMSAPCVLETRLDTIPATVPYLTPDATQVATWRQRLSGLTGLKVGLVWAGDPRPHDPRSHAIDRRRSIALSRFAPLLAVRGIRVVSLQKGPPAAQMTDIDPALRPLDMMETVIDFADTAALVANLDLVITVDTSVAHLVGAMGKPVWILSRFDGCWRWLAGREDSPWYPTARVFHQTAPGDWDRVIVRVAAEMAKLAGTDGADPLRREKTAAR